MTQQFASGLAWFGVIIIAVVGWLMLRYLSRHGDD